MFINGVANFLFNKKKATFSPLPFCIGSYNFTKVKGASEFVKYLDKFRFGEKSFRRNDTDGKVAEHCKFVGVRYEYTHYFDKDEEVYGNASNMTALSKHFKKKGSTSRGKYGSTKIEKQLKKKK